MSANQIEENKADTGTPDESKPSNGQVQKVEPSGVNLAVTGDGHKDISPLPLGKESHEKKEEDEEIFSFFKKYIALLTAAGSLPLLTAGTDVISPPSGAKNLSVVSSLACVIVLGVCILFKSTFANPSVAQSKLLRTIPPYLAAGFLLLGLVLTAHYSQFNPDGTGTAQAGANVAASNADAASAAAVEQMTPPALSFWKQVTLWWRAFLNDQNLIYLLIQPCFVAALGITLMASYSQFRGAQLAKTIDQSFVRGDDIEEMKSMIKSCAQIVSASTTPAIKKFHQLRLKQIRGSLETLSAGYVESSGLFVGELHKMLCDCFDKSFHAVSDRDLKFWMNSFHDSSSLAGLSAKECFKLNIDAVRFKEVCLTRIFIFEDSDFSNYEWGMNAVLAKHHEAGIGWAVLLDGELPSRLKVGQRFLNFAIMDGGDAVAMFTKDDQRRFYVCMRVPSRVALINEYRELYDELKSQCWIASRQFCEVHHLKTVELSDAFKEKEKDLVLKISGSKVIQVNDVKDIPEAIELVRVLRRKNMLCWEELVSRSVVDLEGDWSYSLEGVDAKGGFKHHGTAQVVIDNRQAYFSGTRLKSARGNEELRDLNPPARWQSSPIEFDDDGSMEFKSVIDLDEKEVRGLARVQFDSKKQQLHGDVYYIVNPGQAVNARVIFTRSTPGHKTAATEHSFAQ